MRSREEILKQPYGGKIIVDEWERVVVLEVLLDIRELLMREPSLFPNAHLLFEAPGIPNPLLEDLPPDTT